MALNYGTVQLFEQDIGTLKRSLSNKTRRFSRISEIALVTHCNKIKCSLRRTWAVHLQTLRQWFIVALCGVCAPADRLYCFFYVALACDCCPCVMSFSLVCFFSACYCYSDQQPWHKCFRKRTDYTGQGRQSPGLGSLQYVGPT